tara:strand:+ start:9964 stop:10875 length:912 start_codon:yes stop_codon:yes gene_type:complete
MFGIGAGIDPQVIDAMKPSGGSSAKVSKPTSTSSNKSVMAEPSSDLFSSIGALVGMVASGGNPMGAAFGGGLGALAAGGSIEDAIQSGIGSLFSGATLGPAGLSLNLLGYAGDSSGNSAQQRGAALMNAISQGPRTAGQANVGQNVMNTVAGQGKQMLGGITGGISNLFDLTGVTKDGQVNDPILMSMILNQIFKPQPSMTPLQQQQFATGERNPNFRGVQVPNVPSQIIPKAQGGMIEGPGTGKSDSIPAAIYQNGGRVQEARLSDGEFVMTADAVKGAGNGNRAKGAAEMYKMMRNFERKV